jgi:hypothetical protein
MKNIHYTGEWAKDFTEVTMIGLKKGNQKLQNTAKVMLIQPASLHIQKIW